MIELMTEFRFSCQIWTILLGFGLFCLDLGHTQRRRSPEADAGGGRRDGHTDGQIPPVFYRFSSPSGPLPKKQTTFTFTEEKLCRFLISQYLQNTM